MRIGWKHCEVLAVDIAAILVWGWRRDAEVRIGRGAVAPSTASSSSSSTAPTATALVADALGRGLDRSRDIGYSIGSPV